MPGPSTFSWDDWNPVPPEEEFEEEQEPEEVEDSSFLDPEEGDALEPPTAPPLPVAEWGGIPVDVFTTAPGGINAGTAGNIILQSQPSTSFETWHHTNVIQQPHPTTTPQPLPASWPPSLEGDVAEYIAPKRNKYDMVDKEEFYNKKIARIMNFKGGRVKGDIGLEIECEGTHLFKTPFKYWSCHEDGSLRHTGDHAPVEYVLKVPIAREEVRPALEYLDEKLKGAGSKIVHSPRTSVHVHVNCQEMTVRELYCYLGLYMIFEELLVEWSGPERAGNLFCLRAKDSDFYVKLLESVLKEKNFKSWREEYRYAACNVASMVKFGSLEFRSMKGTVDVDQISTWVNILTHLKDEAAKYDNPVEIVEEFISIGPLPFFKKIFPGPMRETFSGIQGVSGKLWDGLRMFRDIAYCSDWKPPEKKSPDQEQESDVQEKVIYKTGDPYIIPSTGESSHIRSLYQGRWWVKTHPSDPAFHYEVPVGCSLYYVTGTPSLSSSFLFVDCREGPPE